MLSLSVVATSNESLFSGLQPMRSAYLRNEPVAYGELKISCETWRTSQGPPSSAAASGGGVAKSARERDRAPGSGRTHGEDDEVGLLAFPSTADSLCDLVACVREVGRLVVARARLRELDEGEARGLGLDGSCRDGH